MLRLPKDDSGKRSALVKFSTRQPVASHILLCLAVLGDERKFTSNLLADSVGINPVVVRNVHAGLGGKLDEADQAMEARLASVTLQDIADETRERMKAQDAEDAHGSRE